MTGDLPWTEQADVLGVRIRAYFFDPAEVDARADFTARQLPILPTSSARLLAPEGHRASYRAAGLQAYPDAVLAHGNGLLCLTYRGDDGRWFEPGQWQRLWRADLMLQCLAAAMAVAGQTQQPTAALWRGSNLLCQFDPSPAVLECLANNISAAQLYWHEPQQVSPAQLASFCEPKLRVLPGLAVPAPAPTAAAA